MKKIFNFRPIFYTFISLLLGIYFFKFIFSRNFLIISFVLTILIGLLIVCLKFKTLKRFFLIFGSFMFGIIIAFISVISFNPKDYSQTEHIISGRIATVTDSSYVQNAILDKVIIDGKKLNSSIKLSVKQANTLEEGYVISFKAKLKTTQLFNLGVFDSYSYKYNIKYSATINDRDFAIDSYYGLTWSETLRKNVKDKLMENMGKEEAALSYASLFGDKTYISDDVNEAFSLSGITHLIAISGLNITFIVGVISIFLNKIKIRYWIKLLILSLFLLVYCYLCSFASSVVRAALMFIVLGLSKVTGKKYDSLNSLGLTGIILILFQPLIVFDFGFLLSFASILCIVMFMPSLMSFFEKLKFNNWLSTSLGMLIATQMGLLPISMLCYDEFSLLSFITNFICIPIFELFFSILFALVLIIFILPFLSFTLKIPEIMVKFVIDVSSYIASLDFFIIEFISFSSLIAISLYFAFFIMSHHINLTFKMKAIISVVLVGVFAIVVGINSVPVNSKFSVTTINSYDKYVYFIEFDGTCFCIGDYDYYNTFSTNNYLSNVKYKKADYLICLKDYYKDDENFKHSYKLGIEEDENTLTYNKEYNFNGVELKIVDYSGTFCGIYLSNNKNAVLVINDKINTNFLYSVIDSLGHIDILLGDLTMLNEDMERFYEYAVFNNTKIVGKDDFETNCLGNWTFELKNDKMRLRSLY